MGHRKTGQENLEKGIGKALQAMRQVDRVAWRLANRNAGASKSTEEKSHRRTAQISAKQIVLGGWTE